MWYAGSALTSGDLAIGYATSPDGITWTKYAGNPVLVGLSGGWDHNAWSPTVLNDGGTYRMWYSGSFTGPDLKIGYATSPDGITWTKYAGNPVLLPTPAAWDSLWVHSPAVIKEGGSFTIWYAGSADSTNVGIGRATSPDGIVWTKDPANPVLTASTAWEGLRVYPAAVNLTGGTYNLTYVGAGPPPAAIGQATSLDGIAWTRDPSNPILSRDLANPWESSAVAFPDVINVAGVPRMYYAGNDGTYFRVGLATFANGYPSQGTFDSAIYDSGAIGTSWNRILWNATTAPSTEVTASARAGDSPVPDGTWSSWTPPASISPASITLPRSRYLQVRAILSTTDQNLTPALHDISIDYTPNSALAPTLITPTAAAWTASVPGLQWRFEDADAGDLQRSYQVQVDSTPGFLAPSWDSGPVLDTGNTTVPGAALADGEWFWRVRTQDVWGLWGPYSTSTSFRLDATPPSVQVAYGSPTVLSGTTRFVAPATPIWLNATDGAGIGGEQVLYGLDGPPATLYSSPVTVPLPDGNHDLTYLAMDALGNTLPTQSVAVVVDGTPPSVSVEFGTPSVLVGATRFVTPATLIWLNATDGGVGTPGPQFGIDAPPSSPYSGAFVVALPDGPHDVNFTASDLLGNQLGPETVVLVVDASAPSVAVVYGSPNVPTGPSTYITPTTLIWLNSTDGAGVGVENVTYGLDGPPTTTFMAPFVVPLPDGPHTITYTAVDALGNSLPDETVEVIVDATPPPVSVAFGLPTVVSAGTRYVAPTTSVWLNSSDGAGVGGEQVYYGLDGPPVALYAGAFSIPLADGPHTISHTAVDGLGNSLPTGTTEVILDGTSPVVTVGLGIPSVLVGATWYVTPATPIWLNITETGVGIATFTYRIDGLAAIAYSGPFTLPLPDGPHTISYGAADLLGNALSPLSFTVIVDGTAPEVAVDYGSPTTITGITRYVSPSTVMWLNGTDTGVGGMAVLYEFDGQGPAPVSGSIAFPPTDGPHTLTHTATDALGNAATRQVALIVDGTGPIVLLSITSLERGFRVSVLATDAGAGVGTIYVSVDGAVPTAYDSPFIVDDFGLHHVSAYAVDLLGNEGGTESVAFEIVNWKPVVAGIVGVLGILVGLLLVRRGRDDRIWMVAAFVAGGAEVLVAIVSFITGVLGIPPWIGLSLALDVVFLVVIVAGALMARRGQPASPEPSESAHQEGPKAPPQDPSTHQPPM